MFYTFFIVAIIFLAFYFFEPLLHTLAKHVGDTIAHRLGLVKAYIKKGNKRVQGKDVMITKGISKYDPQTGRYKRKIYVYTETSSQPPKFKVSIDEGSYLVGEQNREKTK